MSLSGLLLPLLIYGWILLLHRCLPARIVRGYIEDASTGGPVRYRINGIWVALLTLALWAAGAWLAWWPWDLLWHERWAALAGAFVLGIAYTLWVVLPAPPTGRGLWVDLFLGRRDNIRRGGYVDDKMLLYLFGAVMLLLNALSFAAHHVMVFGDAANPGVLASCGLLCFFALDYLAFERVHLYTYDIFAERVGFKLGWGCLVFYPYFYVIGLWSTVALPTPGRLAEMPWVWLGISVAVFLAGWGLARGANMQKYRFKCEPQASFLGIEPRTIAAGNRAILCSGFWGAARHINYLGEILMALGIVLALGHFEQLWPWLYPLYYVALLFPRERDDDRRCAEKYGAAWHQYRREVPRRIVPGLY